MKKLFLLLLAVLVTQQGIYAQAKQRRELLLQIAALQVYMDYAKKGYSVVSKGLRFIGDAKKGELNLHEDYFTSLSKINPRVRNYYKAAEIVSMQFKIMSLYKKTCTDLKKGDLFEGRELDHIERSFKRLLENCSGTLDQLLTVTTDSRLELKDDQRIQRIDALHKTMLEDYNFCISFSRDAKLLALSKAADQKDAKDIDALYGL